MLKSYLTISAFYFILIINKIKKNALMETDAISTAFSEIKPVG